MESAKNYVTIVVLLLLCLICQICAFRMQHAPSAGDAPTSMTTPPSPMPVLEPSPAPQNSAKMERDLASQYQKLRKLESQADFLEFTRDELALAKAFKEKGAYFDCFLNVNMDRPDLLEHVTQLRRHQEDVLQHELALLEDYIEQEDFSDLTEGEFNTLMDYVEDRQKWAQIAYDASVDIDTKVAVCKSCFEPWAQVWQILNRHFEAVHGSAYRDFEEAYDNSGLEQIFTYTNPWWINRTAVSYRDETGQQHCFRIKLFED